MKNSLTRHQQIAKRACALPVAALGLLISLGCVNAQEKLTIPELTVSDTPPTQDVQVQNPATIDQSYMWYNYVSGSPARRDVAQTFQVDSTFKLTSLTIAVKGASAPTGNAAVTVAFHTFSNEVSTTPLSTVLIATSEFPANIKDGYVTFDLSAAKLTLKSGQQYGFQLSFDSPAENRVVAVASSLKATGYPDGTVYTFDGSKQVKINTDLGFFIQGTKAQ